MGRRRSSGHPGVVDWVPFGVLLVLGVGGAVVVPVNGSAVLSVIWDSLIAIVMALLLLSTIEPERGTIAQFASVGILMWGDHAFRYSLFYYVGIAQTVALGMSFLWSAFAVAERGIVWSRRLFGLPLAVVIAVGLPVAGPIHFADVGWQVAWHLMVATVAPAFRPGIQKPDVPRSEP